MYTYTNIYLHNNIHTSSIYWYISWVYPTQDSSGKWRFSLGFPTKNVIILVVTVSGWGVDLIYIPWAPKTMKNKGFGHLKTRLFTIKTSKNVGFGGPWYIFLCYPPVTPGGSTECPPRRCCGARVADSPGGIGGAKRDLEMLRWKEIFLRETFQCTPTYGCFQ